MQAHYHTWTRYTGINQALNYYYYIILVVVCIYIYSIQIFNLLIKVENKYITIT